MFSPKVMMCFVLGVALTIIAPFVRAQEAKQSRPESGQSEHEAMYNRYLDFASYVKGGSIARHWMADGSSF